MEVSGLIVHPSFDALQDEIAVMLLIQLLLDAKGSEHGPVFQDAAWVLLAKALQELQSLNETNRQQKVAQSHN